MGFVAEINGLSPGTKNFIFSLSCLMPFWYVCIFLFNPYLFYHSTFYLTVPLCFCFSLLWYLVSLALNGIMIFLMKKITDADEEDEGEVILIGGLDSIIYLAIAVVLGYWSKSKHDAYGVHYHFKSFLWLAFIFALVRAVTVAVLTVFIHNEIQKEKGANN